MSSMLGYYGFNLSKIAAAITACDLYWNNVSSLLHFNGANGSTTFTDEKGLSWTTQGDAAVSTTVSSFGGSSLKVSYAGSGRLQHIASPFLGSGWDLGSSYTIEADIFPTSFGNDAAIVTIDALTTTFFAGVRLDITTGGIPRAVINATTGVNGTTVLASSGAIPLNVKSRIALSVSANTARLFVNGVQTAISAVGAWPTVVSQTPYVGIGGYSNGTLPSYSFNGYIDEVRVTKGIARYASNFTPDATEFPACLATEGVADSAPYWRIYITANNGGAYTAINEWQFYETSGGTDLTDLGTPSFNQSSYFTGGSAQTAAYLTNNDAHTDPNDAWVTNTGASVPSWANIGLKNAGNTLTSYAVREIKIYPQSDASLVNRAPKDFLIQCSQDQTNWFTVKSFTNVTGWVSGTAKTFTIQE